MSITQPQANAFFLGLLERYKESPETFNVGPLEIETYKKIKSLTLPEQYFRTFRITLAQQNGENLTEVETLLDDFLGSLPITIEVSEMEMKDPTPSGYDGNDKMDFEGCLQEIDKFFDGQTGSSSQIVVDQIPSCASINWPFDKI